MMHSAVAYEVDASDVVCAMCETPWPCRGERLKRELVHTSFRRTKVPSGDNV